MMLISVITPVKDSGNYIYQLYESLKRQLSRDWEWVIVNDNCNDEETKILYDMARNDRRLQYIAMKAGVGGASAARNVGFERSQGRFVMFVDADDILSDACLSTRIEYMSSTLCDYLVFPQLVFLNEERTKTHIWNKNTSVKSDNLRLFCMGTSAWPTSGPVWKRDAFLKIGGWNESLSSWQDWDLHMRALLLNLKYEYVEIEPDVYIRRSSTSVMARSYYLKNKIKERIRLLADYEGRLSEENALVLYKTRYSQLQHYVDACDFSDIVNIHRIVNSAIVGTSAKYRVVSQLLLQYFCKKVKMQTRICRYRTILLPKWLRRG